MTTRVATRFGSGSGPRRGGALPLIGGRLGRTRSGVGWLATSEGAGLVSAALAWTLPP